MPFLPPNQQRQSTEGSDGIYRLCQNVPLINHKLLKTNDKMSTATFKKSIWATTQWQETTSKSTHWPTYQQSVAVQSVSLGKQYRGRCGPLHAPSKQASCLSNASTSLHQTFPSCIINHHISSGHQQQHEVLYTSAAVLPISTNGTSQDFNY